jgi:uncharacterized protein YgfB (UPF0149 family)
MIRKLLLNVVLPAIFAGTLSFASAQDTASQLLESVNALRQQQAQIAESQTKTDEKIADLVETIRVARIFMSRDGGKHKPPPPPKK